MHSPSKYTFNEYFLNEEDDPLDPMPAALEAPVDCQGVEIKVGDHVAWHIGGRSGSGLVFGLVKTVGQPHWERQKWPVHSEYDRDNDTYQSVYEWRWVSKSPEHLVSPLRKGRASVSRGGGQLIHYIVGPKPAEGRY